MKKELISEISRIHKIMGVKNATIIKESTGCPLCDVINSKIDDLARKFANKEIGYSRFQYEVDDLIKKVESGVDNTGKKILNSAELEGLTQIKKNLDNLKKTSDNIDSYKTAVKNTINNADLLSKKTFQEASTIKTNIIDNIDWDAISKTQEYSDYVFKNSSEVNGTLSSFDSDWLSKTEDQIKKFIDTYKTIDVYAENIKKVMKSYFIESGIEETLSENLSNMFKTWTKENPNINKHFVEPTTIYKKAEDRTVPQRFGKNYDDIDSEYYASLELNEVDPHFIKPLDLDNGVGYSMENFTDSKTLQDYLGGGNKISEKMADDIKLSIEKAHDNGLCHGDLNTNNILIKNDGSDFRIIDPVGYPPKDEGFKDFDLAKADDLEKLKLIIDPKNIKVDETFNPKNFTIVSDFNSDKFLNLINQFVESSDPIKRVSILKILTKTKGEKDILDAFVTKFSDNISQTEKIQSIDQLFDPNKIVDLTNLAKSLVQNKQTLVKGVYPQFNQVRYPNLIEFASSSNALIREIKSKMTDVDVDNVVSYVKNGVEGLSSESVEKLSNGLQNINKSTTNPDVKKFIENVLLDVNKLSDDLTNVKFQINRLTTAAENFEVKQVAGVKINESELKNIQRIVKERGVMEWGWDRSLDEPLFENVTINGEPVKFTISRKGPRRYDGNRAYQDKIYDQFEEEYLKEFNVSNISFEDFLKKQFKNDQSMLDRYFPKYNVSGGVKMADDDGFTWVIVNPELTKKKNIDFVTFHEMTHVGQKSDYMSTSSNYRSRFSSSQDALEFMNSKTNYSFEKGLSPDKEFEFWKFRISPEAGDVIANYRKLTGGADPFGDYNDFLPFKEWALKNQSLVGEKFFKNAKIYENIEKNNFSTDVKRRSLLLSLEETRKRAYQNGIPEGIEKIEKMIDNVKNLPEDKLNRYLKNNVDDPMLSHNIIDSAKRLGYGLNIQEMEANFTALIRELMENGTNKENVGLATWIVNYLKKNNKLETLSNLQNKQDFSKQVYSYMPNLNIAQKSRAEKYANNSSEQFWEFLEKIEKEYKAVYPDDAQKLYSKLYKQAYQIISKGFPVVAGVVFADGITDIGGGSEVTTESFVKFKLKEFFEIQ
jgi:hypothetical protein